MQQLFLVGVEAQGDHGVYRKPEAIGGRSHSLPSCRERYHWIFLWSTVDRRVPSGARRQQLSYSGFCRTQRELIPLLGCTICDFCSSKNKVLGLTYPQQPLPDLASTYKLIIIHDSKNFRYDRSYVDCCELIGDWNHCIL